MLEVKLREANKSEIRRLYALGYKQKMLAESYGVSQALISKIVRGDKKDRVLSTEQVQEIRHSLKTGVATYKDLAAKFNCSVGTLTGIAKGRTYKDVPLSEKEQELANKMGEIKARRTKITGLTYRSFPVCMYDSDLQDGQILHTPKGSFVIQALDT